MKAIVICNNLLKKNSPAALIEQDLLDEMSRRGVEIKAYCSSLDVSFSPSDKYKTVIVKESKFWKYFFGVIRLIIPDLAYLPDYRYISWGRKLKGLILKDLRSDTFDYIHSFSFEQSCHWLAFKLKREYNIPWVATFFDSWTDYPSRRYRFSFLKDLDRKMERLVAENADLIVHNNIGIAKKWTERYGDEISKKIVIIPLNIDFSKEKYVVDNVRNPKKLQISHIGTFYPNRDAGAFIEAVAVFVKRYPHLREKIQVNFVGRVLSCDIEKIKNLQLTDVFNITGRLSAQECQNYYNKSNVFLSTAGLTVENITYPSKIIKYFYYRKPILGISPKGSILELELVKTKNWCYSPQDIDGIVNFLYMGVTDYKQICDIDHDYWKNFDVSNIGERYHRSINTIL